MNEIPNIGGGVIPNGVINNANPIANKQINANGIPQIGINNGPRIIPTIDPPVIRDAQQSVIRSLSPPVFSNPDGSLQYPTLRVPTQAEFDEAVRAEKKAQEDEKAEKSRGLPDTPVIPPIPQVVVPPPTQEVPNVQTPPVELLKPETGIPIIEVPILGPIPVPPKEQVILAGTTATASVAAALVGKSVVEWLVAKMKPIGKQIFVRGKKLLNRDLTPYELQIYFAFEKETQLKKVAKLLKKEQKAEKLKQFKEFYHKE
jgi:hypothetical protein